MDAGRLARVELDDDGAESSWSRQWLPAGAARWPFARLPRQPMRRGNIFADCLGRGKDTKQVEKAGLGSLARKYKAVNLLKSMSGRIDWWKIEGAPAKGPVFGPGRAEPRPSKQLWLAGAAPGAWVQCSAPDSATSPGYHPCMTHMIQCRSMCCNMGLA